MSSIRDLEKDKFVNDSTKKPSVRVTDGFSLGEYDEVQVTYPTTTTEVFTYKLATVTQAVITITYTATNKKDIQSVLKT